MKKSSLLFGLLLLAAMTFAQAPQSFKYQAVARNTSGEPLENQEISIMFSILAGNPSGTVVYSERHQTTTNSLGLFDLEIGNPDEVVSGVFSEINWGTGSYFLKLELDETGGSNYQMMGVAQLLSVPYSLNSSSLALKSPNGKTFEVTVDDEGNLITNCIPEPTQATTGVDQLALQTTNTSLQGNTPVFGTGLWSIISGTGGNIPEPGNPVSQFFGIAGETYELEWRISNSCGFTFDVVIISFDENAVWQCGSPITDSRDEKMYNTVQIGDQCWMKENINIGTRINGNISQDDNNSIEKYCYGDIEANCDIYGGLYQWKEMMNYSTTQGIQGICPEEWHLPTDNNYTGLLDFLGGASAAGGKMKSTGNLEAGTGLWPAASNGTNSSGFTGFPGGQRHPNMFFYHLNQYGLWWSSTQYSTENSWTYWLNATDEAFRQDYLKTYGLSVRCIKDIGNQAPETPTLPNPEDGSLNQSIDIDLSWTCSDPDGDPLTYDIYFGTEAQPSQVVNGQIETSYDPGTLVYNTTYNWKIVAHDDHGNSTEGQVWSFTTEPQPWQCGDLITDSRDGKTYTTVEIGTQCWFAQNLNVGARIDGTSNQANNGIIEKYCYNNSESYCDEYGGLYQWNEMMQYILTAGVQGICPEGWHVPTDAEWTLLTSYVSNQPEYLCNSNSSYIAKSFAATSNWNTYTGTCAVGNDLSANNATGFTALPGGTRDTGGTFVHMNLYGGWWSSSEFDASNALYQHMGYNNAEVVRSNFGKSYGFIVRCLKDN